MKISELSERTGVSLPTLKMYLREGLLPQGVKSGPNQASYDDAHVQRVRLVHGLLRVGGLSIAAARDVVSAIDSGGPLVHTFGVAQEAASTPVDRERTSDLALTTVDRLTQGWDFHADGPGRHLAANAIAAFESAGQHDAARWYERYVEAALLIAQADLDLVDSRDGREAKAETVVLGTVLGDTLLAGLRRAAQEHIANTRYPMTARNST